jgi:hypothetical protein
VTGREDVWLPNARLRLETLDVAVASLDVRSRADIPTLLTLELVLDFPSWQRVDRDRLFHLIHEARGPGPRPRQGDVLVEVRMDDDLLADVFTGEELTAEDAWHALSHGDWPRALETESWFATRVRQELLPDLAAGFLTSWAKAEEVTARSRP